MARVVCKECGLEREWRARRGARLAEVRCAECGGALGLKRKANPHRWCVYEVRQGADRSHTVVYQINMTKGAARKLCDELHLLRRKAWMTFTTSLSAWHERYYEVLREPYHQSAFEQQEAKAQAEALAVVEAACNAFRARAEKVAAAHLDKLDARHLAEQARLDLTAAAPNDPEAAPIISGIKEVNDG